MFLILKTFCIRELENSFFDVTNRLYITAFLPDFPFLVNVLWQSTLTSSYNAYRLSKTTSIYYCSFECSWGKKYLPKKILSLIQLTKVFFFSRYSIYRCEMLLFLLLLPTICHKCMYKLAISL